MQWRMICSECGKEDDTTALHGHPCQHCQSEAYASWRKGVDEREAERAKQGESWEQRQARLRKRDRRLMITVALFVISSVTAAVWVGGQETRRREHAAAALEEELALCREESPEDGGLDWQMCMEVLWGCSQQNSRMVEEIEDYRRATGLIFEYDCDYHYFVTGWRGWVPQCDDEWQTWFHALDWDRFPLE
jgi:hypothetical protein